MLRINTEDLEQNGAKGDWCFNEAETHIYLRYEEDPFKGLVILPIKEVDGVKPWNWNGNREAPTLTPSILVQPYEGWTIGWHGYLTDGKLVTV